MVVCSALSHWSEQMYIMTFDCYSFVVSFIYYKCFVYMHDYAPSACRRPRRPEKKNPLELVLQTVMISHVGAWA